VIRSKQLKSLFSFDSVNGTFLAPITFHNVG
jgi:hypothetical protein